MNEYQIKNLLNIDTTGSRIFRRGFTNSLVTCAGARIAGKVKNRYVISIDTLYVL